jgi:uncharacterized membrane protein YgcG
VLVGGFVVSGAAFFALVVVLIVRSATRHSTMRSKFERGEITSEEFEAFKRTHYGGSASTYGGSSDSSFSSSSSSFDGGSFGGGGASGSW